MSANTIAPEILPGTYKGTERRHDPRINNPFPVSVQGVDAAGAEFETKTILDNLSARGLYLRLTRRVEAGAELSVNVRLIGDPAVEEGGPRVTAHCKVLRCEWQAGGVYGVAVLFLKRRIH
jgi:hypothetical protein